MTFDRDQVLEMMRAAYQEGYRHGYVNGDHDRQFGEFDYSPDEDVTDSFQEWVQGQGGVGDVAPFPELVKRGPLFDPPVGSA